MQLAPTPYLGGGSAVVVIDLLFIVAPIVCGVSLFFWLVLLLYVPSQQLWSLRDGQFT